MDGIFKALADKNRRIILTKLMEVGNMTVTELLKVVGNISQPTLSSHLAILKKSKLVDCEVVGKWRQYKINNDMIELLIGELSKFIGNGNMAEIKARRS